MKEFNFTDYLHAGYESRRFNLQKSRIEAFIDDFFRFIFFLDEQQCNTISEIEAKLNTFRQEFEQLLLSVVEDETGCHRTATIFIGKFPEVYQKLQRDAQVFLQNDPAAKSIEEIYYAYPGFYAIAVYRFAHELLKCGIPLFPRIWTEHAHSKTGIDIHPGAEIGENFFIDHGTGIVIGETTTIGDNVKMYQGVTLGAIFVSKDIATKRHPTIKNNVTIYSNATILGGKTVIGDNCVIGGNVWITESVTSDSIVFHRGQVTVKNKQPATEPINFVI